jgi:predicted nuclease of restriction endonuclease-like (RecB) superfamily
MSIRKHVSFMLYLFSSFDGIIINITTDILNESYKLSLCFQEYWIKCYWSKIVKVSLNKISRFGGADFNES